LAVSLISSPTTSSNEARALQAQLARDAIEAERAGDVIKAQIARKSFRLVAWMDSIPGDQLLIELFGYSAHVFAWIDHCRQVGKALVRGRERRAAHPQPTLQPVPAQAGVRSRRQRRPSIKRMIVAAERSGKTVTSITTPDGVTLRFGEGEPTEANNPWLAGIDDKVTKQ
jgi:hypothetical protein